MKKSYFLFRYFSDKGLNFPYQLFDNIGNVKSWSSIKEEFGFSNFSNFKWQQLMYALPPFLKKIIKETYQWNVLTIYYSQITTLSKKVIGIYSRQFYSLLVYTHPFTSRSKKYFIELFKIGSFDWKHIYLLPCLVPLDSYSRYFQYKILNNILYLKKTNILRFENRLQLFVISANFLMRQYSIYSTNAI